MDDVAAATPWAIELGASHLHGGVLADPAGHPFCLITKPDWA